MPERATRVTLFHNPRSGSADAADVPALLRRHGASVQVRDLGEVDLPLPSGTERVVVAGGDGSIAPVAARVAPTGIPLAVVPVGTANDLARTLDLPSTPQDAARLAMSGTRCREIDLCWMDGRPFVNVASIGLAPKAAREAHGLKRTLGPLAYFVGGVRAALSADPVRCRAACEGELLFDGPAWQATVAGSGAFGAGSELDADPADGRLDLVVMEAGSRASLARRAAGLRRGTVGEQPGVHTARCQSIELEVAPGTSFNVDGEIIESGPARFRVDAGVLKLVVG